MKPGAITKLGVGISRHLTIQFDYDSEGCNVMIIKLLMHLLF